MDAFPNAWKMKGLPNVGWQQNAASDARGRNEIPVHLMIITDCYYNVNSTSGYAYTASNPREKLSSVVKHTISKQ